MPNIPPHPRAERRAQQAEYNRAWQKTPKGRAYRRAYRESHFGAIELAKIKWRKNRIKKFRASPLALWTVLDYPNEDLFLSGAAAEALLVETEGRLPSDVIDALRTAEFRDPPPTDMNYGPAISSSSITDWHDAGATISEIAKPGRSEFDYPRARRDKGKDLGYIASRLAEIRERLEMSED